MTAFGSAAASALVRTLRATFRSGRTRPLAWRKEQLRSLARMIRENEQAILDAARHDLGRPAFETTVAETGFLLGEVKYTLKHLDGWAKPKRVRAPLAAQPGRAYVQFEPLGLALNIAPWNYPLQLALSPAIGAIAAGNCVVIKPSETSAHTSAVVARYVGRYLDGDAVRVVEGAAPETQVLLEQRWDHIMYTGNADAARLVMEAAARHLTPVTLELGGKCPVVVDKDVNIEVAARRIAWGKYFNAGQTCLAPDYVLVHEEVAPRLLDRLQATIRAFYGEDPKHSADYARVVNDRHFERLRAMLGDGDVVAGGASDAADRYIAPTVLTNIRERSRLMDEEIFGPLLPVIAVPDIETAIEQINSRPRPLALYVFTNDKAVASRVLTSTSSGAADVNEVMGHFSCPELPFGGVGASGIGAYHGRRGFETFSHQRAILDKRTFLDAPQRYPPYSEKKLKFVKRLL